MERWRRLWRWECVQNKNTRYNFRLRLDTNKFTHWLMKFFFWLLPLSTTRSVIKNNKNLTTISKLYFTSRELNFCIRIKNYIMWYSILLFTIKLIFGPQNITCKKNQYDSKLGLNAVINANRIGDLIKLVVV